MYCRPSMALIILLVMYWACVTFAMEDNGHQFMAAHGYYPNPLHDPEICGIPSADITNSPLYLCDPAYHLANRPQAQRLIQSIQLHTLLPVNVTQGTVQQLHERRHAVMGIVVLQFDNQVFLGQQSPLQQDNLNRIAAEIHKQWGVGTFPPDSIVNALGTDNMGILILLVDQPFASYYDESIILANNNNDKDNDKGPTAAVAFSIGERLHLAMNQRGIQQALKQMQTMLTHAYSGCGRGCLDAALAVGIPMLVQSLTEGEGATITTMGSNMSSSTPPLQSVPWYWMVLRFFFCFPMIGIVITFGCVCWCAYAGFKKPGERASSSPLLHGIRCLPGNRVRVGRFGVESCPVCLESFHQVTAIRNEPPPHQSGGFHHHVSPREDTPLMRAAQATVYYYLVCGKKQSPLQTFRCGHCMCQSCWNSLLATRDEKNGAAVRCPICRRVILEATATFRLSYSSLTEATVATTDPLSPVPPRPMRRAASEMPTPTLPPRHFSAASRQGREIVSSSRSSVARHGDSVPNLVVTTRPTVAPAVWPDSNRLPRPWRGEVERLPLIV